MLLSPAEGQRVAPFRVTMGTHRACPAPCTDWVGGVLHQEESNSSPLATCSNPKEAPGCNIPLLKKTPGPNP